MSERNVIEERLRKKQAEIVSLEEKLRAAKIYVQALQDVLKLFGKDEAATESAETKLRPGSAMAQAREVILERDSPVHLDDLLLGMGREVTRESRASLVGSLAAYVRKQEIFTRTAPNTFGLVELGHSSVDEEEENAPPAGFGRQPVTAVSFDDEDVPF